MQAMAKGYITPVEYLEIERNAEFKSEYYNGEMFAMSGASVPHNTIASNVIITLGVALRRRGCIVFTSDMKVYVPTFGLFTYPDVTVACGGQEFLDDRKDVILNPRVVVEVLSPSTERYDRGRKFEMYRTLPSLREYLLIAQDRTSVELFQKTEQGLWQLREAHAVGDVLRIESIDCDLPLEEVYLNVEFPPEEVRPEPPPTKPGPPFGS